MLHYADEMPVTQIQKLVNASRPAIYKCTGKALAAGIDAGLKDFYHRPFEPEINEAAKAWAVNSACTRPEDHGLAAELWTLNGPAKYTGPHAPAAGQSCLSKAAKAAIWRILSANEIRVSGKEELEERILKGINASPVVYRWKKFDLGIV